MPKFTKDSFVQNLAKGQLVAPYLEAFDQLDEEWTFTYHPKEKDDAWHPSGDCLPPVAALYAKALGEHSAKHRPAAQRNFIVGHFWHALLQHILCDKLQFCEPDAIERKGSREWGEPLHPPCSEGCVGGHGENCEAWRCLGPQPYHWTTGSGDIVPLETPSGWRGVFDIKTIAGSMFKQSWRSGMLPPAFADKYEAQVNIYMDFFDEDRALILGVNKDNPHNFIEFEFERNQELIDVVYDKWEYVSLCLDLGVEPDPEAEHEFRLPFTGPVN